MNYRLQQRRSQAAFEGAAMGQGPERQRTGALRDASRVLCAGQNARRVPQFSFSIAKCAAAAILTWSFYAKIDAYRMFDVPALCRGWSGRATLD